MKKLLIICLVLGLTSVASATVSFEIGSQAASVYTITVESTAAETNLYLGAIAISGDVSVSAVGSVHANLTDSYDNGYLKDGSTNDIYIFQLFGSVDTTIGGHVAAPAGESLYTFNVTLNSGQATIDDWTGTNPWAPPPFPVETKVSDQAVDIVSLTIPEPVTIALLGLGGLFLRRRK